MRTAFSVSNQTSCKYVPSTVTNWPGQDEGKGKMLKKKKERIELKVAKEIAILPKKETIVS